VEDEAMSQGMKTASRATKGKEADGPPRVSRRSAVLPAS
jgi:hypothetical protein